MLSIFANELTTQQTELETLLAQAATLRDGIKALKTQQTKVVKIIESLKTLVSELPTTVVAELKAELFNLFSEPANLTPQITTPEPAPAKALNPQTCDVALHPPEIFTNFVTEVPETEVTTPKIPKNEEVFDRWNPADFEPMEYQAENLAKSVVIVSPK
ncbi:hypothetical protein [Floridanema aerugineum]|uniref:Uncharacterized protein n=1 Tax=Floridaenema aerugineum BLCC-F46 TaxID=3153654 RepID=A0ABV4X3A7_9CYAN